MKCPICGKETDGRAVFCTVCGTKIPRCPRCGKVLYQRSRFCENDGTPLPEELFAGFPPERAASGTPPAAGTAPAQKPVGGQAAPLPGKKKRPVPLLAVIVLAILLLAAAAAGYFYLRGNLAAPWEGEEKDSPVSSKDEEWDEPEDESEDDPVEMALERAKDYAKNGRYEKALREIQSALEEKPKSKELLEAQLEYIAAFEAGTLEKADALTGSEDFPAAVQAIREALEVLGGESEPLTAREKEYEALYVAGAIAQADQLAAEARIEEARARLDEAAVLFPGNEDLYTRIRQLEEVAGSVNNITPVSMDAVESVDASSYLSQSNLDLYHTADRAIDGDLSTAWVEGASGDGIGESITFTFDGVYLVSGMRIHAGYQKSADLYDKNARPAILTVSFSGGEEQTAVLQDVNGPQDISFDAPAETSSITLTIASVYPGSKYEDTVISEISFY